jgi:hypothetical protein
LSEELIKDLNDIQKIYPNPCPWLKKLHYYLFL